MLNKILKPFKLEEYLANPTKKLITRDGRKIKRVLCTDVKNLYSIVVVAEVYEGKNDEQIIILTKDGEYLPGTANKNDLFFGPEKHEGWMNIYRDSEGNRYVMDCPIFESKEEAEKKGKRYIDYMATVKIEWEE